MIYLWQDLSYKEKHWHESCFRCTKCGSSLVDKQFGSKADRSEQYSKLKLTSMTGIFTESTAVIATTTSLRPGVTPAGRCSGPGWRRWSTRPGSGTRSASCAACALTPSGPRASSPRRTTSTAPPATRTSSPPSVSSVARYQQKHNTIFSNWPGMPGHH